MWSDGKPRPRDLGRARYRAQGAGLTPPIIKRPELGPRPIDWLGLHREYLVEGEMEVIVALLNGMGAEIMVEFGCRDGRTARVILHNVPSLTRYVGVDVPMLYEPVLAHQRREMVEDPGSLAHQDPRFDLIICAKGSFDLGPEDLPRCNAVFVDGDHSEGVVFYDSMLAREIVKPGGLIIWHDYHNQGVVDVKRVLDRLYDNGWPIETVEGTWLALCRT